MITVLEPRKPGYEAVWNYGHWRLAITQDAPHTHRDSINELSRHMETDEVFTLMEGCAGIFIGDGDATIGNITYHAFEIGKSYVVHAATWHCVCTSPGCKILIVENEDTGRHNTQYQCVKTHQIMNYSRQDDIIEYNKFSY